MGQAVKKTISLPPDERIAREEGKSLSAVIQDALRDSGSQMLQSANRPCIW
jgi:hypothetical protein